MRERLIVKKDFLNLIKGDEIQITTDSDGRVYLDAVNRTQLVRYYGNEKGRWGIDNPCPKNGTPPFVLVREHCGRVNVIEFGRPPQRPPHQTVELAYSNGTENWNEKYLEKIVSDLIELEICEKI